MGIITNLGSRLTNVAALDMLEHSGLRQFLDPTAFISDRDAGTAKPATEVYRFAAQKAAVTPDRCLFVGENLIEVIGAIAAA